MLFLFVTDRCDDDWRSVFYVFVRRLRRTKMRVPKAAIVPIRIAANGNPGIGGNGVISLSESSIYPV